MSKTIIHRLTGGIASKVSPVFADGFESGDLTHSENGYSWAGGVNDSVVAGAARSGSWGLRLTHPAKLDGEDA